MVVHRETARAVTEEKAVATCCHYWIIETASGPVSLGVCRNCHESREFKNSVFDMDRDIHDPLPLVKSDASDSLEETTE